jgi:hypothetical protein
MTKRNITIGSLVNFHTFDDVDFKKSFIGDLPASVGDPIDTQDAVTLGSTKLITSNIDNPTGLNGRKGDSGQFILVYNVNGSGVVDDFTLYAYDGNGPAVNPPWVIAAAPFNPLLPLNERWIAIGGKYCYIAQRIADALRVKELFIDDQAAMFANKRKLQIKWNEDDTADRVLNLLVDAGDRSLTLKTVAAVVIDQDLQKSADAEFHTVKCQANQVIGARQTAEADAGAVSAISLGTGSDQVDRATFNTNLTTLVTEINAIKTTLNNLLAKLRTHGLIAT